MTLFIANRTDGFGARLLNLIVTMMLSERHGGEFRFAWRTTIKEFHALDRAEVIFDPSFLRDHRVEPVSWRRRNAGYAFLEPDDPISDEHVRAAAAGARRGLVVSRSDDPAPLLSRFASKDDNPFARAFARIRFTPALEAVRARAMAAVLPRDAVALHLRAGDIVFGAYRLDAGFENKVITLPVAEEIIEGCLERGQSPVIFGQDEISCQRLADRYGLTTVDRLFDLAALSTLERALFEIVILSRMQAIHGGLSSFVQVPALVGSVAIRDPAIDFSPGDLARIILARLPGLEQDGAYPPLQIAYSYRSAWHYLGLAGQAAQRPEALDGAIRHDPANAYYRFHKARHAFESGQVEAGEAALEDAFQADAPAGLTARNAYRLLTQRSLDGQLSAAPLLEALKAPARLGLPYANLCLGLAALRLGNFPAASAHLKRARREAPAGAPLFAEAARLLRRNLLTPSALVRYGRYLRLRRRISAQAAASSPRGL